MEWTHSIRSAVEYMEKHLLEEGCADAAAKAIGISPIYLQKGFKILTGLTMAEYVRNRRLYLAALEFLQGNERLIDISYKYGYDTPESFTKAFCRFHGCSPTVLRKEPGRIRLFQPLRIVIRIEGGSDMDCVLMMGLWKENSAILLEVAIGEARCRKDWKLLNCQNWSGLSSKQLA